MSSFIRQEKEALSFFCILIAFIGLSSAVLASGDGISAKINGDVYAQPRVIGDIDGDGNKEIIFGATDGKIHIFSANGKEIFRPPYWPKQVDSPILSGVEVSDLSGNNDDLSIVTASMNGTVYCLDASGKTRWTYKTGGSITNTTPVVTDLDGTGVKSVLVNSTSGKVFDLRLDGSNNQVYNMDYAVNGPPAVIDTDSDGKKNVIVKDASGKISVFNEKGVAISEWMAPSANGVWAFNLDVRDVDGDGVPKIISTDPTPGGGVFNMWDANGNSLASFNLTDASHGAPVVADFDGDGKDDFIIAQADGKIVVCDKEGKVKKGWPYDSQLSVFSSPALIDIDGDGEKEIVFSGNSTSTTAKDERTGCIIALDKHGKILSDYPKYIGKTFAPLTFADLDGDGCLEMIAMGGIGYTGPQLHIIKTEARTRISIAVIGQEVTYK